MCWNIVYNLKRTKSCYTLLIAYSMREIVFSKHYFSWRGVLCPVYMMCNYHHALKSDHFMHLCVFPPCFSFSKTLDSSYWNLWVSRHYKSFVRSNNKLFIQRIGVWFLFAVIRRRETGVYVERLICSGKEETCGGMSYSVVLLLMLSC